MNSIPNVPENDSKLIFIEGVLYCAPEMLKMSEANRRRGVEKSWMKQSIEKRQAGDIYGFGMVMYEILFRSLPYPDKTDITGIEFHKFIHFIPFTMILICLYRF